MIYLYERNKTGICVNRVFGYDRIVEIPDTLNGFPVTELGAYIFSDHIEVSELNKKKQVLTARKTGQKKHRQMICHRQQAIRWRKSAFRASCVKSADMRFIIVLSFAV